MAGWSEFEYLSMAVAARARFSDAILKLRNFSETGIVPA
jgi:hypothetical protein